MCEKAGTLQFLKIRFAVYFDYLVRLLVEVQCTIQIIAYLEPISYLKMGGWSWMGGMDGEMSHPSITAARVSY